MGVDESVLEDLKKGWQRKLTQLNVAQFPWDPKPEVAAQAPPAQPAPQQPAAAPAYTQAQLNPTQDAQQQSLSFPGAPVQQQQQQQQPNNGNGPQIKAEPGFAMTEPIIKQEPGTTNNGMPPQQQQTFAAAPGPGGMTAQQRAMQQLSAKYGQSASASINAIQNQAQQYQGQPQGYAQQAQPQAQPQGQGPQVQFQQAAAQVQAQQQRPGQPQQHQQMTPQQQQQFQQYQQHLAAQQQRAQQAAQANGQNGANNSQMDGSSEAYEGVLMQRDANGNQVEMGRMEIDALLHDKIASQAKQMEGGGLMLPLKEATKHRSVARRSNRAAGPSQMDGFEDGVKGEEIDEDAINSDLDDPDDDQEEDDDDDDSMGHIMLCMYDKVQRVKNKWKCTLKDGVLTVNGKEYVFHKATGEYEW
ncbi:transcription factor IIA, alpha/beta subunit [Coniochaeta sp. 2T2.1]|nr:transcription factor IIA, alpha/beta subunit [Coniochaeta sp. 2T2.1]